MRDKGEKAASVALPAAEISRQVCVLLASSRGTDCKQKPGYGRKILSHV